jgi:hypothetical protein
MPKPASIETVVTDARKWAKWGMNIAQAPLHKGSMSSSMSLFQCDPVYLKLIGRAITLLAWHHR